MSSGFQNINLKEDTRVDVSEITKKFSLRGQTMPRPVYRIPLNLLHYNNKNGRIATLISKWESENGYSITKLEDEQYNETIESYIIKSNKPAFEKTMKSIKSISQREAGVVLNDGCIIDGNRRYTCLRRLYEETSSPEFAYFEAVILDPEISSDEKEIKRLELELQHGQDEKVSYNPIEALIDVYKTCEEEKILTTKEYADNIGKSESAVKKDLEQAKIIVDFLDYIGAAGKYYIAVDLQLDASVFEIYNIKQKIADEETWEKAKIVLYESMLVKPKGDVKFVMRDIKSIVNSEYFDDYYNEHLRIAKPLEEALKNNTDIDSAYIINDIRSNDTLKKNMADNVDEYSAKISIENIKKLPIEKMNDIAESLGKIDQEAITHMSTDDKNNFKEAFNDVKKKVEEIERVLNEVN